MGLHFPYGPLIQHSPRRLILRAMRRLALLALLVFLATPAAASALAPSVPDGTLAVRNGDGSVWLDNFRGAVIGRIATGRLVVTNPAGGDCATLLVWGAEV